MKALTCPWCGAPLPPIPDGATTATCAYCSATASLTGASATKEKPAAATPAVDPTLALRVIDTFNAAITRGKTPLEALQMAAEERLGPLGQTDAFARVVFALASELDEQNGTSVLTEPMGMARLVEVYLQAVAALRTAPSYDVNLPFFTANAEGPVHFHRTLTPEVIAQLVLREPPKKKKGWFW